MRTLEKHKIKDADEIGLHSCTVVPLDEIDPNGIPSNIYISKETDPQKAFEDMYWASHTKPFNIALWNPPQSIFPDQIRQDITEIWQNDAKLRETLSYGQDSFFASGGESMEAQIPYFKEDFERAFSPYAGEKRTILEQWRQATLTVFQAIGNTFPKTTMEEIFNKRSNHHLTKGKEKLELHIDNALGAQKRSTIHIAQDKNLMVQTFRVRLLWNQNGHGTYIADNRDIKYDAALNYGFVFTNPEPRLLSIPPGWLALITCVDGSVDPVIHSSPVQKPNEDIMRMLWVLHLEFGHFPYPGYNEYDNMDHLIAKPDPQRYISWLNEHKDNEYIAEAIEYYGLSTPAL